MENRLEVEREGRRKRFFKAIENARVTGYNIERDVGYSEAALSRYRTGRTKEMKLATLEKICEKYGINVNYVLYDKQPIMQILDKYSSVCKKCEDKDEQIHFLTKMLRSLEAENEGYKKECAEMRKQLDEIKENQKAG